MHHETYVINEQLFVSNLLNSRDLQLSRSFSGQIKIVTNRHFFLQESKLIEIAKNRWKKSLNHTQMALIQYCTATCSRGHWGEFLGQDICTWKGQPTTLIVHLHACWLPLKFKKTIIWQYLYWLHKLWNGINRSRNKNCYKSLYFIQKKSFRCTEQRWSIWYHLIDLSANQWNVYKSRDWKLLELQSVVMKKTSSYLDENCKNAQTVRTLDGFLEWGIFRRVPVNKMQLLINKTKNYCFSSISAGIDLAIWAISLLNSSVRMYCQI